MQNLLNKPVVRDIHPESYRKFHFLIYHIATCLNPLVPVIS